MEIFKVIYILFLVLGLFSFTVSLLVFFWTDLDYFFLPLL